MDVSVIICTRNRASQLHNALSSLVKLDVPQFLSWEVIVVDNGSTDNTQDIAVLFANKLPIRTITELSPGLSNARNAGVKNANGRYIIWTDDDVLVDQKWLLSYYQAFQRWPNAIVFGGKVVFNLEPPTPDWFKKATKYLGDMLAVRDFGKRPIQLIKRGKITPFGANYAIRAIEQKKHLYNPSLGVTPDRRWGGEETEVIKKILEEGSNGWLLPDAIVRHLVPTARQSIDYIFDYYESSGQLRAHQDRISKGKTLSFPFLAVLAFMFSFICFSVTRRLGSILWVKYLASSAHHLGRLRYWSSQKSD